MRLRHIFLPLLLASFAGSLAQASNSLDTSETRTLSFYEQYHTIGNIEIERIEEEEGEDFSTYSYANDCSGMSENDELRPNVSLESVDISQIIRIGQEIWKIVKENKPVVEVNSQVAHALPRGVQCWSDLETWSAPKSTAYKISYKNLLGMTVADFKYRIIYGYGGSVDGKGQFLANVTIVPAELDVAWGFKFNADVKVGQALNLGTKANPKAGLEVQLNWRVSSMLADTQKTVAYFVQGDGQLMSLQ